ncbi:MAG TPA: hypothetical protein VNN22_07430 [Verrucomicrobiae bacterium]|nr:hypothetical protein [Verrucomicrobiae bacterium]
MVYSNLIFNLLSGFKSETETGYGSKYDEFPKKKRETLKIAPNSISPTNWGTEAIMLPPMVSFKKISQKSYANDIPK